MYFKKNVITIYALLNIHIMHTAQNKEATTKVERHMIACYNALKDNNPEKFKSLLLENDFYLYHFKDLFVIPGTKPDAQGHIRASWFDRALKDLLYSLVSKKKNQDINLKILKEDFPKWEGVKFLNEGQRCNLAIQKKDIRKLHELLVSCINSGFGIPMDSYKKVCFYCAEQHKDTGTLLHTAIEICIIHLINI